jgi:predicted nucleotidyltransferase
MSVLKLDKNRTIIKKASVEKISGVWKEVVDEIVDALKNLVKEDLVAVYVGGSVATGDAVLHHSDVDTYAIVDLSKKEIEEKFNEIVFNESKKIDLLFPYQRGVEMHLVSINEISEGRKFQLKNLSVCVYGNDISQEIPLYTLNKETIAKIRVSVADDIEKARKWLINAKKESEIEKISQWISKRLIRNAGMLCMWREDYFTMEIPLLVEMFSKYYKEKIEDIETLYRFTKTPPKSKESIEGVFDSFGSWLIEEDRKVFMI